MAVTGVLAALNRPGVAGAVLQTPLSFIHLLSRSSFCSESSGHCVSQTVRAREERMFTPHHVSHGMCHRSGVRCQVSGVRCQVLHFSSSSKATIFFALGEKKYHQRAMVYPKLIIV